MGTLIHKISGLQNCNENCPCKDNIHQNNGQFIITKVDFGICQMSHKISQTFPTRTQPTHLKQLTRYWLTF